MRHYRHLFLLITLSILCAALQQSTAITLPFTHAYALADSHWKQGLTWLERKHYTISLKYLDAHISTSHFPHQHTIVANYYGARCACKLMHVDAVERLEQVITRFPTHPLANLAHYDLGKWYCTQQDYATGISYYLQVCDRDLTIPQQAAYRYNLAYAYLHEQCFSEAREWFNKCKQLNADYRAASNYYAGYLALKVGEYRSALSDLQTVQKHTAYAEVVPYLILEGLYQSGDYASVIAYAQEVTSQQLDCVNKGDISLLTADAYFLRQQYQHAIGQYENYLALEDNAPLADATFRLGYALYETGEYYKAIKYLKELALEEDRLGQLGRYYLGLAYIRTKQKNLAMPALQQAARLTFDAAISAEAAFHYAQLSYELGYESIALEALKTFKQTYPNSPHRALVDKLLSQLYLQTKNYDLAIAHVDSLSHKNQAMRQVYQKATFYKGSTYFNQADYGGAIIWLQQSLSHPLDKRLTAQAHFWLAESYTAQQSYEQAMSHYQAVMAALQSGHILYQDAAYGLAYAYFNLGAYTKALPLFLQYAKANKKDNPWKEDALIRAGDCYYATKDYKNAIALYDQTQPQHPAHSRYQKAVIYTILGKPMEAQQNLEAIIHAEQPPMYYEQALFGYACLALQGQSYHKAITYFTRLLQEQPHHATIPDALLYRAITYVKVEQYPAAEADYVQLLTHYPTHPATENALLELPKLTALMGESAQLQQHIERYKAKYAADEKLERIALETAKNQLYGQHYPQAIEELETFIIQYPDSGCISEAYFLLAEAYYRSEDFLQARETYQKIEQQAPFYNKVLLRIATISYKQQDWPCALLHYTTLQERATSKKEQYYALEGMMKAHAALQHYDEVKRIGQLIIQLGAITVNGAREAMLYSAKASMQQEAYEEALQQLRQLIAEQDVYAAEGKLLTAQIYYQLADYKQSLDILFAFTKQYTQHTSLVEAGFLLIADNYIALEETFQAKATLQSIIDHTTDKVIADKAALKLHHLMQATNTPEADTLPRTSSPRSQ